MQQTFEMRKSLEEPGSLTYRAELAGYGGKGHT